MTQFCIILAAGIASVSLLAVMLKTGWVGALDTPNPRSLHTIPVPRSGGIAILLAGGIGLVSGDAPLLLSVVVLLLAIVSWLDDQMNLSVIVRFAAHFLAASAMVWSKSSSETSWIFAVVIVLSVVWMTNLYNFMDGSDGLAGGMTLFGFSAYAIASGAAPSDQALLPACIAAGAVGFLLFNFNPAKIFMGDVGSIPLGFLAGILGLNGVEKGFWPLWFPILVFSPFVVDATTTLAKRILRGERVWLAHREHYYQKLIRMGWSHRRLALSVYCLMGSTAISGLLMLQLGAIGQVVGLIVWVGAYLAAMAWIDHACRTAAVK